MGVLQYRAIVTYLHQILPVFVLPVALVLVLLIIGLWKRRRWMIWAALAILWIFSTPLVGSGLIRAVEGDQEHKSAETLPPSDAIVVLSGGRIVAPGAAAVSEWTDADRFFGGIELFKAGRAPLLMFTGGRSPWKPEARLEGDVLTEYALAFGIPDSATISTGAVVNTEEEAQAVAAIMKQRSVDSLRVILVTSAFHMKRARSLFEKAGLTVIPFPVDFQTSRQGGLTIMSFLPSAGGLRQSELAIRELYGRAFYAIF